MIPGQSAHDHQRQRHYNNNNIYNHSHVVGKIALSNGNYQDRARLLLNQYD